MSNSTFRNKLIEVLDGLDGASEIFQKFYKVLVAEPEGFPVLMLHPLEGSTETRLDSNSNFVTMRYEAVALWNQSDDEALGTAIATAMDAVMDEFRTSALVDTLGGVVEKFDITPPEPIQTEGETPLTGFRVIFTGSERRTF